MRKMKNTGIPWIAEIPFNWNVTRIKYESELKGRIGWQGLTSEEYIEEGPYLITGVNFCNGIINWESCFHVSKWRYDQDKSIHINEQDLLITKDGTVGKVAIALNCPDRVTLNSGVLLVKNISNSYLNKFLYYVIYSNEFKEWFNILNSGNTTILHLYQHDFENFIFALPPIEEQNIIINYLDEECGKIDSIYKDVEKQIETLEQYKRSIITESVTKGINKEVTLIEDKNEWFLCIPTKWIKTRIGAVYKLRNTKVSDKDYMPLSVTMRGVVPQLENAAKTDAHDDRKLVKKGDFAINSRSDRRGSCGIAPCDGSISLINIVLEPKQNMNSRYYNWLFHTTEFADEFYKWGHGIVNDLWTTTWQEMKNIIIPMPPISEQEEIANFLDKKCAEIDSIIEDKKKQLEILEDYKKSLIYEFVTGKKEVPNE